MTDKYDYGKISKSSKQFAIDDLKEDPARVNESIEQLRKWAIAMPHFNCPTDSNFLLRFLRSAKYDMKAAQKQLDSFCTVRCSHRGHPEYFDYANLDNAMIDEFLNSQVFTPLGRNQDGELIILYVMKNYDPDKISRSQLMNMLFMGYEVVQSDEETQIHGVRLFFDMTDASAKVAQVWADNNFLLVVSRCYQDIFPWRFLGTVFYNMSSTFDDVFKKRNFHLNKKLRGTSIRTNNLEEAFKRIPGLKDLLPIEHGGCGAPLKQYTEKWNKQFKTFYNDGNPFSGITVDESIRHEETLDYWDDYPDYEE